MEAKTKKVVVFFNKSFRSHPPLPPFVVRNTQYYPFLTSPICRKVNRPNANKAPAKIMSSVHFRVSTNMQERNFRFCEYEMAAFAHIICRFSHMRSFYGRICGCFAISSVFALSLVKHIGHLFCQPDLRTFSASYSNFLYMRPRIKG